MIDHFSLIAPIYDRFIGGIPNADKLREILNLPTDGWILDAGGGTGRVSKHLGSDSQGIILCDLSHAMLKQSSEKNGAIPVNSNVDFLPFTDDRFDRILVVDALHHFKNAQTAIREMIRVLKPGGRLVIEEFNINTLFVKFLALAEKLLLMGSHFYRPEEIRQMADSNQVESSIVNNGKHSVWVVFDKPVVH